MSQSTLMPMTTFLEMGFAESNVTEAVSRFASNPDSMLNWLLTQETVGIIPKKIKLKPSDTRTVTYYGSMVKWKGISGTIDGFDIDHSVVRFNARQSNLTRKWLHISDTDLEWIVCNHNDIPMNTAPQKLWRRQVGTVQIPLKDGFDAMSEYEAEHGLLSIGNTDMLTLWLDYGKTSLTHNDLWEAMDGFTSCHVHHPSGIPPRYSPSNMKPITTSLGLPMAQCRHELRIELMSYFITLCDFYNIPMQQFTETMVADNDNKDDFLNKVITLFPADFDPRKALYLHNEYTLLEMLKIWRDPTVYIMSEVEEYHNKNLPMVDFEIENSLNTIDESQTTINIKVFFHDMTFVMPPDQNKAIIRKHFQTLFRRMFDNVCRPPPVTIDTNFWHHTLELSKKQHQTKTQPSLSLFVSKLLPFQQKVVNWMQMRESNATPISHMTWQRHQLNDGFTFYTDKFGSLSYSRPNGITRGGILAQSSGLGKTVEMLALIAASGCTKPTLVIMSPYTLKIWIKEAAKHTPLLNIRKYHGSKRNLNNISNVNIVLTTFRIVNNDKVGITNNMNLKDIEWGRMVIDDFDKITKEPLYRETPLQSINADFKWCMSDDIFKSRISAVGTLFRVFNVTPFNSIFTNDKKFNSENGLMIRDMLVEMTFSQTYESVETELPRPSQEISLWTDNNYSIAYQHLINAIKAKLMATHSKHPLTIRWIRQATIHPGILPLEAFAENDTDNIQHSSIKKSIIDFLNSLKDRTPAVQMLVASCSDGQEKCTICMGEIERPTMTSCNHVFCYECIQSCYEHDPQQKKCPLCRNSGVGSTLVELTNGEIVEDLFFRFTNHWGTNYKIEKKIYDEIVKERTDNGCNKMDYILQNVPTSGKTVIYTTGTEEILHVTDRLRMNTGILFTSISKFMNRNKRDKRIQEFEDDKNMSIIVMDIAPEDTKTVLDFVDNIVFIRPCHYGRQNALNRVIRIGRDRPVNVLTFKTRNTIDDISLDDIFQNFV